MCSAASCCSSTASSAYHGFLRVQSAPTGGTRYQVTDYKTCLPQADNRHQLGAWIRYYLFFKKDHPLAAKLGVPQKISYLAVPILIIVMFYTGLCLCGPRR